jgi:hypothetical protein
MTELRVMAVSSDGARLVLKAADGQEFLLPIDDRLRAAVRGDRARLGQIEIEIDSQLRPRDIQARIRAGASAEEVAELAGIPVDRVRRFEGPVLAERAFMAERAQNTQVRRQGETHGPKLGELVNDRLTQRGADHESQQWDSWRRDDGIWTVRLMYGVGGELREAHWTFDPPRRLVAADDDEARGLISESPVAAEPTYPFVPRIARLPQPPATATTTTTTSMPRPIVEEQPEPADDELVGLLDAVPGLRAAPLPPRPEPDDEGDIGSDIGDLGVASHAAQARVSAAGSAFENALFPRIAAPHRDRMVGTTDRQAEADGVRPGRRATVPSWDEIVFGSRRGGKKQGD